MNDATTAGPGDAHPDRSLTALSTRLWTSFKRKMTSWVKVWQMLIPIVVVAGVGFPLIIAVSGRTDDISQRNDRRANEQAIYLTQVIAYANASNTYTVCVATANALAIEEQRWDNLAAGLERAFAGSEGGQLVVQIIRDSAPDHPLTIADCPQPGEPPQPPK